MAASALKGQIAGPGWYRPPENSSGIIMGEGDGVKEEERMITTEEALEKVIGQLDGIIETEEEKNTASKPSTPEEIKILPGFPSEIKGEILFCDTDNVNVSPEFPSRPRSPCFLFSWWHFLWP